MEASAERRRLILGSIRTCQEMRGTRDIYELGCLVMGCRNAVVD